VRIAITICIIIAAPITESPSSNIYATMLAFSGRLIFKVFDELFHRILAIQRIFNSDVGILSTQG
jgi:hypothetical protein